MVEYRKITIKLTDTQLKNLKTAVKNKTGATLRMSLKMLDGNDLLMNCYRQKDKDKKQSKEMHLITKYQLI